MACASRPDITTSARGLWLRCVVALLHNGYLLTAGLLNRHSGGIVSQILRKWVNCTVCSAALAHGLAAAGAPAQAAAEYLPVAGVLLAILATILRLHSR